MPALPRCEHERRYGHDLRHRYGWDDRPCAIPCWVVLDYGTGVGRSSRTFGVFACSSRPSSLSRLCLHSSLSLSPLCLRRVSAFNNFVHPLATVPASFSKIRDSSGAGALFHYSFIILISTFAAACITINSPVHSQPVYFKFTHYFLPSFGFTVQTILQTRTGHIIDGAVVEGMKDHIYLESSCFGVIRELWDQEVNVANRLLSEWCGTSFTWYSWEARTLWTISTRITFISHYNTEGFRLRTIFAIHNLYIEFCVILWLP